MKLSNLYYSIPVGIRKFLRLTYHDLIRSELDNANVKSVLDVGCGEGNSIELIGKRDMLVGIDTWKPYLEKAKERKIYDELICKDIKKMDFKDKSFDAVIFISVLEHLTKEDGLKVIEDIQRIARKLVVVMTPSSFFEQDEFDDNPYQKHLSGHWESLLAEKGFEVRGTAGLKLNNSTKRIPLLMLLTQPLVHFFPGIANEIIAVKRLD
jgi:ubiquinone/menaquinone biosynthesis C-methylase UbiE